MSTFVTTAIPLRIQELPADNVIAILYTRDKGKVSGIVRGGKKIKSKLIARINTLSEIKVMIAPGRRLDIVAGVHVHSPSVTIPNDFAKRLLTMSFLDVLSRMTVEYEPDEMVYAYMSLWLLEVDSLSGLHFQSWFLLSVWRLLVLLGFAPHGQEVGAALPQPVATIFQHIQELEDHDDVLSAIDMYSNQHKLDQYMAVVVTYLESLLEFELKGLRVYTSII